MTRSASCFALALLAGLLAARALPVPAPLRQNVQRQLEHIQAQAPKLGETMFLLREAGGSFLPEIVPSADTDAYQDMDRRRLMVGVYWMDLTYAATFRQVAPAARFGQAVSSLLDALGHPWPDLERRYRESLLQLDQPGGEDRLHELVRQLDSDTSWQELIRDVEGLELVVDALYGYLIEGLYLAAEIAVVSDFYPDYMRFVSDMRNAVLSFQDLLRQLEHEPELVDIIQGSERLRTITELLELVGEAPDIGPDQVRDLRPAITKARNEIVH